MAKSRKATAKGELTCNRCGAPVVPGRESCPSCGSQMASRTGAETISPDVRKAATSWAKGVFGAPRDFGRLVTSVQDRDEVIDRIFSLIVRRDVFEQRAPWTDGYAYSGNVDPRTVDPFAITLEALRSASQRLDICVGCSGAGQTACGQCSGTARARCGFCGGSGTTLKQYKKSSRLINCKVCRGGGTLVCTACAQGRVTCASCQGRRKQVAWLAYTERSRSLLSLNPSDSPILLGHPQLVVETPVALADLGSFSVLGSDETNGPLRARGGTNEDAYVKSLLASLDPRLERVSYQQYVRVAVLRRDATFELCGKKGVLVLSGNDLRGASTKEALAPIKTRLLAWAAGSVGLVFIGLSLKRRLSGNTPYFEGTDAQVALLVWLAIGLGILALGALLRELKPKLRLGTLLPIEKAFGVATAVMVLAAVVVSVRGQPKFDEVHEALARGDVAGARLVTEALSATLGATKQVSETDDLVILAEARSAPFAESLKLFDAVARRGGAKAPEAGSAARTRRLEEARRLVQQKDGSQALSLLDGWFGNDWKSDREVAELKARAEEVALERCQGSPCGLAAARKAALASPTPARLERVASGRSSLLSALNASPQPAEPPLAKLQRLRALAETASDTLAIAGPDRELADAATQASRLALEARAKTPLIGASEPIVAELVAPFAKQSDKISVALMDGVAMYAVFDKQRLCRGLYAVGPVGGSRALTSSIWSPERILFQAFGRAVALKRPTSSTATVSRWAESGVPVVARWRSGLLVELRIGDAAP
jgi:hypothetical protein